MTGERGQEVVATAYTPPPAKALPAPLRSVLHPSPRAEALREYADRWHGHVEPAKPTTLADILTALRSAGRTTRDIAAALGVHVSTVYRWLKGRTPNPRNSAALAAMI